MGYSVKHNDIVRWALKLHGCKCEKPKLCFPRYPSEDVIGCVACRIHVGVRTEDLTGWYHRQIDAEIEAKRVAATTTTQIFPMPTAKPIPPSSPSPGPAATRHAPAVPVGPLGPALPQQPQAPSQGPGAGPQFHHQLVTNARGQVLGIHSTEIKRFDYKTHWLMALTKEGQSFTITRWERPPTTKEVETIVKSCGDTYLGFAVVNTVGLV